MEENYFISGGVDDQEKIYYIQNTDPIVWCDEISEAKKYDVSSKAEFDVYMDQDTIRNTFNSSSMNRIEIFEIEGESNYIIQRIVILRKGQGWLS